MWFEAGNCAGVLHRRRSEGAMGKEILQLSQVTPTTVNAAYVYDVGVHVWSPNAGIDTEVNTSSSALGQGHSILMRYTLGSNIVVLISE